MRNDPPGVPFNQIFKIGLIVHKTTLFPPIASHMVVLLTEKEKQEGSSDLVVNRMSSQLGHLEAGSYVNGNVPDSR